MEVDLNRKVKHFIKQQFNRQKFKEQLKVNGKGRIYNQNKPPSKILTKVVNSLYNKQFPKEPKPTRRIKKGKRCSS